MKLLDHVANRISGKRDRIGLPIAVIVKPPIIERGPVDAQFLQLRNGVEHLLRRHTEFVAPTAPAHRVVLFIVAWLLKSFLGEHFRPEAQRLIKVTLIDGKKRSGGGKNFSRSKNHI